MQGTYMLAALFVLFFILWIVLCGLVEAIERLIIAKIQAKAIRDERIRRISLERRRAMFWNVQADVIPNINKKSL